MSFSGIYVIINTVSNKVYVGQAVNIKERWKRHDIALSGNKHRNAHLQAAWNIYGKDAFIFETLELCKKEKTILTEAEQYWMDYFKFMGFVLYNMVSAVGSCIGYKCPEEIKSKKKGQIPWNKGKVATEEAKLNMSLAHMGRTDSRLGKKHSEETKKQITEKKLGSKASEETKAKMSASHIGRTCSEETKKKISKAHLGRPGTRLGACVSEETKVKMSTSSKGKIMSCEARAKMSMSRIGKKASEETKAKISTAGMGRVQLEESKVKMSVSKKGKKFNKETRHYE